MFYGIKLKSVRELFGFSRNELANKIGVTEQAIWQYENNAVTPKFDVILKLNKLFSVRHQFFYSENYVDSVIDVETIAYRSEDRELRKKRKTEKLFLEYVEYIINYFESYVSSPASNILELQSIVNKYLKNSIKEDRTTVIENIANIAREFLSIDDNEELLYKLELSGIRILEKNVGSKVDAYSVWSSNDYPYIVLGSQKKSSARRNFDLAHEFGHLLLHYKYEIVDLPKKEYDNLENEANQFASFFLLPKKEFFRDFEKIEKKSNPNAYVDLKLKYKVSIAALELRAYKAGRLTFQENRYFQSVMTKRKYRQWEPYDTEIALIRPGKIKTLYEFVLNEDILSGDEVLKKFHVEPRFFNKILCVDDSLLEKKVEEKLKNTFYNNIISFGARAN